VPCRFEFLQAEKRRESLLKKLKEAHGILLSILPVKQLKEKAHPYIPNSVPETKLKMMREIGIEDVNELYSDIPTKFLLRNKLNLPKALSEFEITRHVQTLLRKHRTCDDMSVFVGAGCWPHYIPAVVDEIAGRSELSTSYTPYQPEISQGMLQTLYEYQSMMCDLTDMGVTNCSMYDWASALGEAARMAARVKGQNRILIPKIIHPDRAATLKAYSEPAGIHIEEVAYEGESGQLDLNDLRTKLSESTGAVYIENPSYLGFIEEQVDEINELTHACEALLIVGVDPTSLGLLRPPGQYGADIVVGEAQPLGNPMSYGGPLLGIMACRDDMSLIRQMPGRIIGKTKTIDGSRDAYCMALQTREQHIRREKATSNICTNEALCAVASAVYLALLGPEGMRELGEIVTAKSNYAMRVLSEIPGIRVPIFKSAHFKEFTVNFDETGLGVKEINEKLLERNIQGGKDLSEELPQFGQTALYCTTEIHTKREISNLADSLKEVIEER
jgi:glycine dehydrogenase subunit 1